MNGDVKRNEENLQLIKTSYINYLKLKTSDSQIDCRVVPKKGEPKDGKRN